MQDKKKILRYITELSKILQDSVNESEEIQEILEKLREEGVGLSLNFVALISGKSVNFNLGQVPFTGGEEGEVKFEITDEDKKFLSSLGIVYE